MPAKQFACVQVRVLSIFVAAVASGTHDLEDIDERALIVGNGASLMPGTIVGQGKYVLAEKIGDSGQGFCQAPNEMLLAPSNQEAHISSALVPRDGLTQAIAQDLPNLPKLPSPMPSFLPAVFRYSGLHMHRGAMLARDALRGYQCSQRLGRGSFGEVWRAVALDGSMREVVLKRFFVEQGEHVRQSGLREISLVRCSVIMVTFHVSSSSLSGAVLMMMQILGTLHQNSGLCFTMRATVCLIICFR